MLLTFVQFWLACSVLGQPDNSILSPPVKTSDKKFFGKDYPWDKRPGVDVLHFKHPYPVVQDSDDFDHDFVKDENSDNGEFVAQTEYDRLRHKLAKEKTKVAKAMESIKKAEKEVEDVLRREASAKEREKKRIQEKKEKEEDARKRGQIAGDSTTDEEKKGEGRKYVVPESKTPGGMASPGEVEIATGETEKAMDKLEECKKQLKEAQEKLKKLVKELEEAKKQQEETQAAVDTEGERLKVLEAEQTAAHAAAQKEYKEYVDAKEAYEKQQYLVFKMQADIEAAARKVKAVRDAEDKDGGVYPTSRNEATQCSVAPLLTFAIFALTICTLVQ